MRTMITVSIVATRKNAVGKGPYLAPSQRVRTTATTNWTNTAKSGDRYRGCVCANAFGRSRILPMAYQVLVVALAAAFELAMAELATARKTTTHPPPHTARASPSHGLPPPNAMNPANFVGPKKTTAAYVVRM